MAQEQTETKLQLDAAMEKLKTLQEQFALKQQRNRQLSKERKALQIFLNSAPLREMTPEEIEAELGTILSPETRSEMSELIRIMLTIFTDQKQESMDRKLKSMDQKQNKLESKLHRKK